MLDDRELHRDGSPLAGRDYNKASGPRTRLRAPAAIEGLFTTDADQHTTSGEWRRGWAQVTSGSLASSTGDSLQRAALCG